jgi:TetR/AcrR family fatty acid metabolism transcriptional regulator
LSKRKSADKYFRIIRAATKIFAKKGFYQTKVSDIAKEAGVADGTIYIYFQNKDDILISLFEERMRDVFENMAHRLSKHEDPDKQLEEFALAHLQLLEQDKDMAEVIQVELRQSGTFMKEYKNENFAKYLNLISDIIRTGQERGIFRKEVLPGVAKRAFFGALDEMSRFWVLSSRKQYDIQTAAKQISGFFMNGIRVKH